MRFMQSRLDEIERMKQMGPDYVSKSSLKIKSSMATGVLGMFNKKKDKMEKADLVSSLFVSKRRKTIASMEQTFQFK